DSTLLFLAEHADPDEADELCEIQVAPHLWTLETGEYGSHVYEIWHPDTPEPRDEDYTAVVYEPRPVVVLSTGLTNLRFLRPEHMPAEI
ncbi:hypothetical protein SB766_22025, partial [Pseudomonas sp. SIMBA_077]